MDRRRILFISLLGAICTGCGRGIPPEFPHWVASVTLPRADANNAYTQYVSAAEEAESQGHKYLQMVAFYPGQRMGAMKASQSAVGIVESASSKKCDFEFTPVDPFDAPPHQQGWRLIGRDLVWKIQDSIKVQQYDQAVNAAVVATKFGFDISGGSATDASLGFAIADEARRAIAPSLNSLSPTQLANLATGVEHALDAKPSLSQTINNEHENMLECVQIVQNDYRDHKFDDLAANLGADSRSAIEYLKELEHKDGSKRPQYFNDFAAEAKTITDWMNAVSVLPGIERQAKPEPKFLSDRPWKKFSKEFFSGLTLPPSGRRSDNHSSRSSLRSGWV